MSTQVKQKIQLLVDKKGNSTIVDVTGAGGGCQELTSGLEKLLGIVDEQSREKTAAAFESVDPLTLNVHEG